MEVSQIHEAVRKYLIFTNANTYSTYNFTLAPDPLATIFTVPNIESKYGKDYIKYSECTLQEFQEHVPKQFLKYIDQHFKQYMVYMFLEVGSNGLRHYHGQIVSTEPALTEIYLNDLIGRIAFQFTGRFRSNKVLQNHPCLRIYLNNKEWKSDKYESYEQYITKTSNLYFCDIKIISKYYQEKWQKRKSILLKSTTFKNINEFIKDSDIKITKANVNIPKLSAAYKVKQDPQLQILLNLKNMFKYEDIKITISTEDLDKIL